MVRRRVLRFVVTGVTAVSLAMSAAPAQAQAVQAVPGTAYCPTFYSPSRTQQAQVCSYLDYENYKSGYYTQYRAVGMINGYSTIGSSWLVIRQVADQKYYWNGWQDLTTTNGSVSGYTNVQNATYLLLRPTQCGQVHRGKIVWAIYWSSGGYTSSTTYSNPADVCYR